MLREENRIQDIYKRRRSSKGELYSWFNKGHVFLIQELERAILALLVNSGIDSLATKTILDIGCGSGYWIQEFLKLGAVPENLAGIDLLDWRVNDARRILPPGVRLECGNAEKLGFSDRSFDVVVQFTVFSSILDPHMKRKVASEMLRVLKEDGFIIWHDFFVRDPRNSDVRAITKNEIHQLFPGCQIDLRRITVAAPLTRLLAPYSWLLCYVLERIKVFDTHYLGIIRKLSD
jgi:SAM-dependent methyltransferase